MVWRLMRPIDIYYKQKETTIIRGYDLYKEIWNAEPHEKSTDVELERYLCCDKASGPCAMVHFLW